MALAGPLLKLDFVTPPELTSLSCPRAVLYTVHGDETAHEGLKDLSKDIWRDLPPWEPFPDSEAYADC